jgi:UTP--glucose-1-phosphate uridylyltransferase
MATIGESAYPSQAAARGDGVATPSAPPEMNLNDLPADLARTLARFHFERVPLDALRQRLREAGGAPESLHAIRGHIAPPPVDCAIRPPTPASTEALRLAADGAAAIARGELAVVVLAGGMATRYGSVVKALAPLGTDGGERFVDVKLADVARWSGAVPAALMTSFATHDLIAEALVDEPPPGAAVVTLAPQFVSLRLTPGGDIFLTDEGVPSPHSTGHGDLPEALAAAGTLAAWRAAGVRTVLVSNVDNLGATVDPTLFAMHRESGARVSVELVEKRSGDRGGLPVLRDDRLVLAETFRLPAGFPDQEFPLFNTNTLWVDLDALESAAPWTWCAARKSVEGRDAIQFERLVGELTWWHETQYLHVPREGAASRFLPIKEFDDLARSRDALVAMIAAQRAGAAARAR